MTEDHMVTTEEANEAAASYANLPMTDERLAEIENDAEHPPLDSWGVRVRELVTEIRRLQKKHDPRCISLIGEPQNRIYCDCKTLAIIDYAKTVAEEENEDKADHLASLASMLKETSWQVESNLGSQWLAGELYERGARAPYGHSHPPQEVIDG